MTVLYWVGFPLRFAAFLLCVMFAGMVALLSAGKDSPKAIIYEAWHCWMLSDWDYEYGD